MFLYIYTCLGSCAGVIILSQWSLPTLGPDLAMGGES